MLWGRDNRGAMLRVLGGPGDDALFGHAGKDEAHGGPGDDTINGGRDEVSALAGFDTAASQGKTAGWMRLTAVADGAGAGLEFQAVGEVAIYKARL